MFTCTYVHMYMCTYVYMYMYMYMYMSMYMYIYTHTYTRIPPPRPNWPTVGCLVLWCSLFFQSLLTVSVCVCAVRSLLANRSRRDKRQRFGLLVFKLSFNSTLPFQEQNC